MPWYAIDGVLHVAGKTVTERWKNGAIAEVRCADLTACDLAIVDDALDAPTDLPICPDCRGDVAFR